MKYFRYIVGEGSKCRLHFVAKIIEKNLNIKILILRLYKDNTSNNFKQGETYYIENVFDSFLREKSVRKVSNKVGKMFLNSLKKEIKNEKRKSQDK